MTREPHDFSQPVRRVGGGGDGRARLVAVALAATIGGAILLAATGVGRNPANQADGQRTPPAAAALHSARPETASPPAAARRHEALPQLRDDLARGSPVPTFFRRSGDDLEVMSWTPGDDRLELLRVLPGAYKGFDPVEPVSALVAPGADRAFIRSNNAFRSGRPDTARIVSVRGTIWERRDLTAISTVAWSRDGSRLVVPARVGSWWILRVEKDDRVTLRTVDTRAIGPPGPQPDQISRVMPVGFSADGKWAYGEVSRGPDFVERSKFRVAVGGGRPAAIERFPTTGNERLLTSNPTDSRIDEGSGRTFRLPTFPDSGNGGAPIAVQEPDGSPAYRVTFDAVLGAAWLGDGRLLAVTADSFPSPTHVELVPIGRDGSAGLPILATGQIGSAGIVGVRDGYVLIGFSAGDPTQYLIAILRVADGTMATLRLTAAEAEALELGGWEAAG